MKRILSYFTAGAFALSLSTLASAQTRPIGAGALVLDDGAGHSITLLPPQGGLTCTSTTYYLPAPTGICGTDQTLAGGGIGMTNPMTTIGDMVYASATGTPATPARLAGAGTNGSVLTYNTGTSNPQWTATLPVANGGTGATTLAGLINLTAGADVTGTLPIANGGTGATTLAGLINLTAGADVTGTLPIANGGTGATTLAGLINLTGGADVTGTLPIANGGTGATTLAGLINLTGGADVTGTLPIANGGTGATTLAGLINLTAGADVTGTLPIANGGTGATTLAGLINLTGGADVTGTLPIANGGTGATTLAGLINLTGGADVTGTLPVANGGTGNTSIAAHAVVLGEGASALGSAGPGALNTVLHGTGNTSDPTFSAVSLIADVSGTLPVANGGTGATTLAGLISLTADVNGILPIANGGTGANSLANLINLTAGADVTGILPVANGGTGANSLANLINLTAGADVTGILPIANGGTGAATVATNNQVFAGPASGAPGAPSFRGLASGDIPNNAANTTGSATNIVTTATATNAFFFPTFVANSTSSISTGLDVDGGMSYNPSSNTLMLGTAGVAGGTGNLSLANATGANITTIQAGASAPSATYILPTTLPGATGDVLQANSTTSPVQLSWVANSGSSGVGYNHQYTIATNPAGTANTTFVSMGLGSTIQFTPNKSGDVLIMLTGAINDNAASDIGTVELYYAPTSTTPPANGVAEPGAATAIGSPVASEEYAGTNHQAYFPFTLTALIPNLTVGTTYWIDLAAHSSAGGNTTTVHTVGCTIVEF